MAKSRSAERLVDAMLEPLPLVAPGLFNPWTARCAFDSRGNGPAERRRRLARHLDVANPRLALIGEAPGYRGCRYAGVAFTSERLVLDGAIPRVPQSVERLTVRSRPFSEPTATVVWATLFRLGVAEHTVAWNALPLHPHAATPWSNRTPTTAELALGTESLRRFLAAFPHAQVVAVGRSAQSLLGSLGVAHVCVRHPANGGATEFSRGLERVLKQRKR